MREILFRGKKLDPVTLKPTDEWVEGYFMRGAVDGIYMIQEESKRCHIVDGETVGEYTGLTDKNGKRVFEGDIVQWGMKGYEYPIRVAEVKIAPDIQFCLKDRTYQYGSFAYQDTEKYLEIIGNIHDNPELLEEQQ